MAIYAETAATAYAPAPEGNHPARCVQMIDLGTQANKFDPSKAPKRKVQLVFELPTELRDDHTPHLLRQKFSLTMHEKGTLRKFLQGWRGRAFTEEEAKRFDITVLLGKACLLNVIHETKGEKTYANITGATMLPKGMEAPAQITPTLEFSLDPGSYDGLVLEALADYLKDEIKESPEYKALQATPTAGGRAVEEETLPF